MKDIAQDKIYHNQGELLEIKDISSEGRDTHNAIQNNEKEANTKRKLQKSAVFIENTMLGSCLIFDQNLRLTKAKQPSCP